MICLHQKQPKPNERSRESEAEEEESLLVVRSQWNERQLKQLRLGIGTAAADATTRTRTHQHTHSQCKLKPCRRSPDGVQAAAQQPRPRRLYGRRRRCDQPATETRSASQPASSTRNSERSSPNKVLYGEEDVVSKRASERLSERTNERTNEPTNQRATNEISDDPTELSTPTRPREEIAFVRARQGLLCSAGIGIWPPRAQAFRPPPSTFWAIRPFFLLRPSSRATHINRHNTAISSRPVKSAPAKLAAVARVSQAACLR